MQDYLDLLYPLIPLVHRPTFMRDLHARKDSHDPVFLSLIAAICALLVTQMPRKFVQYCSKPNDLRFGTRIEMADFCINLIMSVRKIDHFDNPTIEKLVISYMTAVAYLHLGSPNRVLMIMAEAMQFTRLMKLHQLDSYNGIDHIESQLRKKAFCLMLIAHL